VPETVLTEFTSVSYRAVKYLGMDEAALRYSLAQSTHPSGVVCGLGEVALKPVRRWCITIIHIFTTTFACKALIYQCFAGEKIVSFSGKNLPEKFSPPDP
jgi:hypothetical protein